MRRLQAALVNCYHFLKPFMTSLLTQVRATGKVLQATIRTTIYRFIPALKFDIPNYAYYGNFVMKVMIFSVEEYTKRKVFGYTKIDTF